MITLPRRQVRFVEWVQRELTQGLRPDQEFKVLEVTGSKWGDVFVYAQVGLKGDEGTAAATFCLRIDPRGGLRLLKRKGLARGRSALWATTAY